MRGTIHSAIVCKANPDITYGLYLPKIIKPVQSGTGKPILYPVMVAFDPHGDGKLPLTLYRTLADKFGFILAGSNNSKNGLPGDEIRRIVSLLMHDIRTTLPVDTTRIYLLGFSGGARVAANTAMYQVPVRGLIGCGAGFGNTEEPVLYHFDFFGMAGTGDFNMTELMQMDEPLDKAGFRHFITTFPGIHAWPPAGVMQDAFEWVTLNAMKDGQIQKDDVILKEILQRLTHRTDSLQKNNELIAAVSSMKETIAFLDGLTKVDTIKINLEALEKSPRYNSQLDYRSKVMKQEEEEKQLLIQSMKGQDLKWWKVKINSYSQTATVKSREAKVNPEDTLKNRRILAFLSLFCYMNANSAIAQQQDEAAMKIVSIYAMADPGNPEPWYMTAILMARKSDNQNAMEQIRTSISKGFSDKKRLSEQPEFNTLKSQPGWAGLINSIK